METDDTGHLTLTGTIERGVGTGGTYVAIPGFSDQFERLLGGKPFPGTLNVRIDEGDRPLLKRLEDLKTMAGITIHGFSGGGKDYFPAIALRCTVLIGTSVSHPVPALIVFPEITVHPPEVLEIIATERILDSTKVGDQVSVRF